ncbi:VirB4-like conjugal transfer ATPase, CD1110 family, partial [uncultured Eubacterium sp.]|uniref:VirB4-like conjugal transfer ATPase, CD1110 family n=1 Tax=uncultured Eubacterium sp. TaxID=165185 RepID=UPI0035A57635
MPSSNGKDNLKRRYRLLSTANAKHAGNRRKLTRAEKKEIAALIRAAKGDGKAHTAQQTIPYLAMYPDGICKVTEKKYSKSIAYDDINYQLAQADDKTAIFENWCDFLNYFDATVSVQLSFINRGTRSGAKEVVAIPAQNDAFNSIRTEYADMLKHQLAKGNNGFVKSKYITFSVEADNLNAAKARLARIETDILNNFKVLGAAARPMTGYERLEALHSVFHPEGEPFRFSWDWLTPSGLTTKDFIAPSSFRFGEGRYFRMGRKIGAVSFLEILAPELNDRMLADILDLETGIVVNLHIKSIDQTEAIKTIKRKITDLDKMKIEEQKKAVRSGYDMDIIPSDLAMFGGEAKNLLQDLQSR